MTDNCPCCFQKLPKTNKPRVSLEDNVLIWGGLMTKLSPTQAEMLHVLTREYPAWVSGEKLITEVYGALGNAPDTGYKIFSVMACKIRERLQESDVPLTVENGWTCGQGGHKYRIRFLDGESNE